MLETVCVVQVGNHGSQILVSPEFAESLHNFIQQKQYPCSRPQEREGRSSPSIIEIQHSPNEIAPIIAEWLLTKVFGVRHTERDGPQEPSAVEWKFEPPNANING